MAAPNKLDAELYEKYHERAYEEACRLFYPAIDHADVVLVWSPEDKLGEHTLRDINYARQKGKLVIIIDPNDSGDAWKYEGACL